MTLSVGGVCRDAVARATKATGTRCVRCYLDYAPSVYNPVCCLCHPLNMRPRYDHCAGACSARPIMRPVAPHASHTYRSVNCPLVIPPELFLMRIFWLSQTSHASVATVMLCLSDLSLNVVRNLLHDTTPLIKVRLLRQTNRHAVTCTIMGDTSDRVAVVVV